MISVNEPNVLICFSQQKDGDLSFYRFEKNKIETKWNEVCDNLEVKLPLPCFANQVHGKNTLECHGSDSLLQGDADGLFTADSNIPVGIFTADCTPVILYGENFVAALHAGWKGTLKNISGETVNKLRIEKGIDPKKISAVIGPCINQCCLEMGEEVYKEFLKANPEYRNFFKKYHKQHLNMRALNRFQLIQAGLNNNLIKDIDVCTFCSKDSFFSYRRQKQRNGSMFSFAVLKKSK